jgi:hypothetical protein
MQFFDEGIDRPDRVIRANIVVREFGKQGVLTAIFPFDKSLHRNTRGCIGAIIQQASFTEVCETALKSHPRFTQFSTTPEADGKETTYLR